MRIGVVGAGTMGSGIALACLLADLPVTLCDVALDKLASAREYLEGHLDRKGKSKALQVLATSLELNDLRGSDVIIEAALENLEAKQALFRDLDACCPAPAILATNTSTLSVTAIAAACGSPHRVAGMHFFNPAPVMPLVEVVRAAQTSDATLQGLVALAERLGKKPVVTQDTPGFIVNRVARPFYGEALRLLGEGVASHEQIDRLVERAGFPMGPFRLMDLIGIDVNFAATQSMYERSYGEPRYRPHWIQAQKVLQNALGRKTGIGFYRYDRAEAPGDAPEESSPQAPLGRVLISPGHWAPGLSGMLLRAGGIVVKDPGKDPMAAFVVAGREEGAQELIRSFDAALPANVPLLCQAADVTLSEMAGWVAHPERLIGFDGLFLSAATSVELTLTPILEDSLRQAGEALFAKIRRGSEWVQDSPGLVLPRIVGMLINEAAFAVGEAVADFSAIDQAMTLGMNHSRGPFAWAEMLGHARIVDVLDHLHAELGEERYRVAPVLRRTARLAAAAKSLD